ncbi:MAG TPA: sugar ABC transporter permease [Actinomycetota bacterium]
MSPWLLGFSMFFVYPMAASLWFSFTHYDLLGQPRFIGLANYRYMFTKDQNFWLAVRNTVWVILVAVPARVVFAVGAAMLLTKARRAAGLFRTIFYLPVLAPPVAATLGFVFLFNPTTGPVNHILHLLHLPQPLWFSDPRFAKPALVLLALWGIGDIMIIFLASLLDVPVQLYEAADIEGANAWQKARKVTLPMISPVILFALIIGIIDGLQYFTQGYVASVAASGSFQVGQSITLGYPQGSTLFFSVWLYQNGFEYFRMGYASALAWTLFLVTLIFTLLLLRISRRWVHYQGGVR